VKTNDARPGRVRQKIKIDKRQKHVRVPLALMHHIRDQLEAMNTSAAHAGSWVLPRSHATSYLIDTIDSALGDL
jgi:hypothetical protein